MADVHGLGRFPGLASTSLDDEQRGALARLESGRGNVPAPYRFLIASPLVVDHLGALGTDLRKRGDLTDRELEIVILVTAQHFRTPFVQAAHRRLGRRAGLSEAVIDAILEGRAPALDDERERCAYRLAVALHAEPSVPQALAAEAEHTLGRKMIAEIIALIGNYTATCYTMRFVDAQASELPG